MLYLETEVEMVANVLKPFFVYVAPLAPNFSHLEIDLAEQFFSVDPELSTSIASLKTLDFLTVDDAGDKTVMMLRALRSSLTKVEVHFDLDVGPSVREDRDPLSYLHRSQDTLRCISLRSSISSPTPAACYRNVRILTLNYVEIPTTRHFIQAFPNLQCLRATECKSIHDPDPDAAVERQRDLNVAEQALDGSWSGMTLYKGSIFILYVLGLGCQVSHIYVHDDDRDGMEPRQIRAVLGDTRPLHLTIMVHGVEYFLALAHDFVELSGSREFKMLASLSLEFQLWRGSWNADMEGLMVRCTIPAGACSLASGSDDLPRIWSTIPSHHRLSLWLHLSSISPVPRLNEHIAYGMDSVAQTTNLPLPHLSSCTWIAWTRMPLRIGCSRVIPRVVL